LFWEPAHTDLEGFHKILGIGDTVKVVVSEGGTCKPYRGVSANSS
jgi:hypothetical protein